MGRRRGCEAGDIDTGRRDDDDRSRTTGPRPPATASAHPPTVDPGTGQVRAVVVVEGDGAGRGRRVVLRLDWLPGDPLCVRLDVEARPDHPALPRGTWVVLRDFLRYGLLAPTGDGDVRIHPDPATDVVWLTLARRTRPYRLAVPAPVLAAFLQRTEEAVGWGEERTEEELEELIATLLRR